MMNDDDDVQYHGRKKRRLNDTAAGESSSSSSFLLRILTNATAAAASWEESIAHFLTPADIYNLTRTCLTLHRSRYNDKWLFEVFRAQLERHCLRHAHVSVSSLLLAPGRGVISGSVICQV